MPMRSAWSNRRWPNSPAATITPGRLRRLSCEVARSLARVPDPTVTDAWLAPVSWVRWFRTLTQHTCELGGAVRNRRLLERPHHGLRHVDRPGGQDNGFIRRAIHRLVEKPGELGANVANGAIHRLVEGVVVADHRAERNETDVPIQLLLRHSPRHHDVIVATVVAVVGHHGEQARQDAGASHTGTNGEEAHLAQGGSFGLGQMRFQASQFLIQGEGSAVADANHTNQFIAAATDEVGIIAVEPVDEYPVGITGMLGHLFNEGGVIELSDLGKLPILVRSFEDQRVCVVSVLAGGLRGIPLGRGGRKFSFRFRHKRFGVNRSWRGWVECELL